MIPFAWLNVSQAVISTSNHKGTLRQTVSHIEKSEHGRADSSAGIPEGFRMPEREACARQAPVGITTSSAMVRTNPTV
jgi:hypothetical protein